MLHAIIPPATNRPGLESGGQRGKSGGAMEGERPRQPQQVAKMGQAFSVELLNPMNRRW